MQLLLKQYIRSLVESIVEKQDDKSDEEQLDEFSGCAAIAGAMGGHFQGGSSNKKNKN